jgi:hypothetical protein
MVMRIGYSLLVEVVTAEEFNRTVIAQTGS